MHSPVAQEFALQSTDGNLLNYKALSTIDMLVARGGRACQMEQVATTSAAVQIENEIV